MNWLRTTDYRQLVFKDRLASPRVTKNSTAAIGHCCPNTTVCAAGDGRDKENPAHQLTKVIRDSAMELTKVTLAIVSPKGVTTIAQHVSAGSV